MKNHFRLFRRYLGISAKAQLQYKTSFFLDSLGQFLVIIIEFLGIASLFQRFDHLVGWQLPEVAIFYGQINIAFAISDMLNRGFDYFGSIVKHGEFDRILLRPRSTIIQLIGYELSLKRIGRLLQGLLILVWGAMNLSISWTLAKMLLLLWSVMGTVCLFMGLFIIQAVISFRTIESLEIMNTMTYGGAYAAQYPLGIYRLELQRFFTYIVPLAGVNYFPVVSILEKNLPDIPLWLGYISPVSGFLFLLVSLIMWRIGVRYYQSTGS